MASGPIKLVLVQGILIICLYAVTIKAETWLPSGGGINTWHVQFNNSLRGGERTIYACKLFEFSKIGIFKGKKHQIVGFTPVIDPKNLGRVHHILINKCKSNSPVVAAALKSGALEKPSVDCFKELEPELFGECIDLQFVWTIGSKGLMFPENTGIPIEDDNSYYMFQVHYDNPSEQAFTDESGGEFHFTDAPRQHDSSFFSVAHRMSLFHLIPPGLESHKAVAFCSKECTEKLLPKYGITITDVLLHAHLSVTKFTLRHLRNGIELAPLQDIQKYDPNIQEYITLSTPRKVLPGDELIVECTSNTKHRTNITLAGPGALQEMCYAFIHYYPKSPISTCVSQPEYYSFLKAFGIENVEGDGVKKFGYPLHSGDSGVFAGLDNFYTLINITNGNDYTNLLPLIKITKPDRLKSQTFEQFLQKYDWKKYGNGLQDKFQQGKQYPFCDGAKPVKLKNFIVDLPKVASVPAAENC